MVEPRSRGAAVSDGDESVNAPRILVVDDSSTMRRIIVNTLNRIGYGDIAEAEGARDALNKLSERRYDLVITDLVMPEIDGVMLTGIIRQSPAYHDVPIIMVTGRSAVADIVAAVKAGVSSYVIKPFTTDVLKEKIDRALAGL